ncbi:hypothetical protein Peur_024239 [Populus x canadensis]
MAIILRLHLLKNSPAASIDGNHCSLSARSDNASDLAFIDDDRAVDSNGVICISSSTDCCNEERTSSGKRLNVSQSFIARLSLSASSSETATRFMKNTCQLKMRVPPMPSSHACSDLLDDSQDPYAFEEDDFQPSKWDLLSGKRKISRTRNGRVTPREAENGFQYKLMSQEESSNGENGLHKSSNREHHHSQKSSYCNVRYEEHSSLLADCLLTAIKNDIHLTDQELDLLVAILGLLVNLVEKDGE